MPYADTQPTCCVQFLQGLLAEGLPALKWAVEDVHCPELAVRPQPHPHHHAQALPYATALQPTLQPAPS
jgi:hypothetical protein